MVSLDHRPDLLYSRHRRRDRVRTSILRSLLAVPIGALLLGPAAIGGCGKTSPSGRLLSSADAATDKMADDANAARDPAYWPFATVSPWNVPLGTGAVYDNPVSAATQNLRALINPTHVNSDQFSIPVFIASAADRAITVGWTASYDPPYSKGTVTFPAPSNVAASPGSDADILIVSPDHRTGYEFWKFTTPPTTPDYEASYFVNTDLTADGWSGGIHAAGCSLAGGLIRAGELAALHIPHALTLALDAGQLAVGPVWPAISQDGDAATSYSGLVHQGQLVAIPPAIDVTQLGLTPAGLAAARSLQDYGAYVVDRSVGMTFYVEPAAAQDRVDDLRTDAATLQGLLVLITNNSAMSVGGGGTPRVALAPPLD